MHALREATIKLGVLAVAIHVPGSQGLGALGPVESVLQALVGAGLDIEEAGQALALITELAYIAERELLRLAEDPFDKDISGFSTALRSAAADDFPVLCQVVAASEHARPDNVQLEFSIDLVIAGLERLASSHG